MHFDLLQQKKTDIPSASGLVKKGAHFFVIGDDSPHLFKLDSDFEPVEKTPLFPADARDRIPKIEKADLEAMEMISEEEILAFGSGSLSPQRDVLFSIKPGSDIAVEKFPLTTFYSAIKELKIMEGSELNIEAAAFYEENLFLFNRRKNVIFSFSLSAFRDHLIKASPLPSLQVSDYELPKIQGIEAGFSGATITASGKLLVTCSVEDTENAYDDGEVLGSFIGISSGFRNGIFEEISWTRIPSEAPLKVESVCVERENSEASIDVVMVTDSDGADSLILKGTLELSTKNK